jgi:hypothetical protein
LTSLINYPQTLSIEQKTYPDSELKQYTSNPQRVWPDHTKDIMAGSEGIVQMVVGVLTVILMAATIYVMMKHPKKVRNQSA